MMLIFLIQRQERGQRELLRMVQMGVTASQVPMATAYFTIFLGNWNNLQISQSAYISVSRFYYLKPSSAWAEI